MIRLRNLDEQLKSIVLGGGVVPGTAELFHIGKEGGAAYEYWDQQASMNHVFADPSSGAGTAISDCLAQMTSGRNDIAFLSPDSHTLGTALDWNKNMTHLVGAYPTSMMNQRSRIGHNENFTPMLTVSGYGNMLANLYFMYGRGNAANKELLKVTGDRNSFYNCHFGGPMHTTEGDQSDFHLVNLSCGEVYFNHCVFGVNTVNWTDGSMLYFYGPADRSVRAIFEDCLFLMQADNAQVRFITTTSGQGAGFSLFKRCMFMNVSGTSLTYAIDGAGLGNFKIYADINTTFAGVTDIVAAANEANVMCGHGGYTAASKLANMMVTNPDVS